MYSKLIKGEIWLFSNQVIEFECISKKRDFLNKKDLS